MEWRTRWGYEIAAKRSAPGIWKLKTGGYLVSVRARDARTGKRHTRQRALPSAHLEGAKASRAELRSEVRAVARGKTRVRTLWSEFAASLFERKAATRDLKSAKSIERWQTTLTKHLVPAFGDFWCDELRYADLEEWRARVALAVNEPPRMPHPNKALAKAGRTVRNTAYYSPRTINGWISILGVICRQMTAELELGTDPSAGLRELDTSEHPTYTDEEPNALTPEKAPLFLARMREMEPQHYPMVLLGVVTGLRPSSMRPLRRRGPEADIDWDTGELRVRRSNAKGQAVMNTTKTGKRQKLTLPAMVLEVLRSHVASFEGLEGRGKVRMPESDLLFPAVTGKMRARSVLDKPFQRVSQAIGLPFRLTPRGLRRSFKDLARAASVPDVVAKAISGHVTDSMHERYSTASKAETTGAMAAVHELVKGPKAKKRAGKGRSK